VKQPLPAGDVPAPTPGTGTGGPSFIDEGQRKPVLGSFHPQALDQIDIRPEVVYQGITFAVKMGRPPDPGQVPGHEFPYPTRPAVVDHAVHQGVDGVPKSPMPAAVEPREVVRGLPIILFL